MIEALFWFSIAVIVISAGLLLWASRGGNERGDR